MLRKSGILRLSKSGKALEIYLDDMQGDIFSHYFYVSLEHTKEVIEKRRGSATVSERIADNTVSGDFDRKSMNVA